MSAAVGRAVGLPLPSASGLPSEVVSKAEVEAVKTFEGVFSDSVPIGESALGEDASRDDASPRSSTWPCCLPSASPRAPSTAKAVKHAVKAATGRAYKQLREMLKDQCNDEYLVHCEMTKEKARDGSIEFVSADSKECFLQNGQQCLIWNDETLKRMAAAKAAMLKESLESRVHDC